MTEYKSKVKYEAPIEINIEEDFPDYGSMAVSEIENMIFSAVLKVGITVDKEELIKALRYDRGQYEKGYADGILDAEDRLEDQLTKRGKWITIRLNNGGSYTGCSCCEAPIPTDTMLDYIPESESKYCYSCGARMEVQDG